MSRFTQDPLLGIARLLLGFMLAVFTVATAACLLAIPAMFIFRDSVIAEVGIHVSQPGQLIALTSIVLLMAAGVMAVAFYFTRQLQHIVHSMDEGDPFIPENAQRLSRMGWLALGVHVFTIPLGIAATRIAQLTNEHSDIDVGVSGGGIVLILTLFILARVFRQGAQMRDELEGTV